MVSNCALDLVAFPEQKNFIADYEVGLCETWREEAVDRKTDFLCQLLKPCARKLRLRGAIVPECKKGAVRLLSRGKRTSQSSTGWSGSSSRAVDGRTDGRYCAGSCTHTHSQRRAWWKVNLGKTYSINKVVVWNRVDCCRNRLNNFDVFANGHRCGRVGRAHRVNTVRCHNRRASTVMVRHAGKNYLTLCEVQVYGSGIHIHRKPGKTGGKKAGGAVRRISLQNGWSPYGHGYEAPSATKYGSLCIVSGLIRGRGRNPMLTLPSYCRPNKRVIFNLNNHQNTIRVDVLPNGQVHRVAGRWQHGWINLDGIQLATSGHRGVSLRSGWRAYGGSYGSPTYTRTGIVCEVEGLIRSGHWGRSMAHLPGSCRPKKRLIFNLNNHGKTARVDVQTNGHVTWHAGGRDHHWISLGGIMFAVDRGSNLPLHYGWRNYGHGYGSATVSKSGSLCLVSGLIRGGHWSRPMVTLPSDCRPKGRLIFNMNNHQNTARVDVLTNGQVKWVAGGRSHHWISLTGIHIHR
jgi:hypothetical protein